MKEFKKDEQGNFICEECKKIFKSCSRLSTHIGIYHKDKQKYYDKWLKEKNEGLCKICSKKTKFNNFYYGYKNCCSKKCSKIYKFQCLIDSNLQTYGVKYVSERKDVQEKKKQTNIKRYGSSSPLGNNYIRKKSRITLNKNFGVDYPLQNEDIKQSFKSTCLELYGFEYALQSKEIIKKGKQTKKEKDGNENYNNMDKNKQTCLKLYGVENVMQNPEIFEKAFKNRIQSHHYLDTNLTYQASYEKDFLDIYHEKFIIENGKSFKYILNGKIHVYHSDFFIPLLNLIVEIKNSYHAERYKEMIEAKKQATLNKGYNYIMIVDKDYTEFDKLIKIK